MRSGHSKISQLLAWRLQKPADVIHGLGHSRNHVLGGWPRTVTNINALCHNSDCDLCDNCVAVKIDNIGRGEVIAGTEITVGFHNLDFHCHNTSVLRAERVFTIRSDQTSLLPR